MPTSQASKREEEVDVKALLKALRMMARGDFPIDCHSIRLVSTVN